jgi:hypothetical protein
MIVFFKNQRIPGAMSLSYTNFFELELTTLGAMKLMLEL